MCISVSFVFLSFKKGVRQLLLLSAGVKTVYRTWTGRLNAWSTSAFWTSILSLKTKAHNVSVSTVLVKNHPASSSVLLSLQARTNFNMGAGQFPHTPAVGKNVLTQLFSHLRAQPKELGRLLPRQALPRDHQLLQKWLLTSQWKHRVSAEAETGFLESEPLQSFSPSLHANTVCTAQVIPPTAV